MNTRFSRFSLALLLSTGFVASLGAIAQALEVKVLPQSPEKGDTLSVWIETDSGQAPQVQYQGQTYRAFPEGENSARYRALLPTTPLDANGHLAITVSDRQEEKTLQVWLRERSFPTQRITLRGSASQPATAMELAQVAELKKLVTPTRYWQGAFLRPSGARVSTIFGVRRYYNGEFAQDYYHRGVDYAGGYGSPVVSPAAGKIALVGYERDGFRVHGNIVGIDHGQGVISIMMHLNSIDVEEGEFVQAGQKIGGIGSTGASTGPHLHWGLYVNGQAVDPVPWRFGGIQ